MILTRIGHGEVPHSDILFQSGFWADFKESLGQEARCFMIERAGVRDSIVVLLRVGPAGERYAYVPRGPRAAMAGDGAGACLEELSEALRPELPTDLACVRYDTEFPSPYTDGEYWTANGQWKGAPRTALRELRMNWGTKRGNLRKSPLDHLCPDTVIVDLRGTEEALLARMRATTRNCVRRAFRSGVEYRRRGRDWLPEWHRVYADTARRKGFYFEGLPYFERLFDKAAAPSGELRPEFRMLSASKDGVPLAGAIVGIMGRRGYYLYAGSVPERRECMPNYGLQWEAIRLLRDSGCTEYDLMGVPPNGDPNHSMYGLYTFKTGLGGTVVHYCGCWDYPFDGERYERLVNAENMGMARS